MPSCRMLSEDARAINTREGAPFFNTAPISGTIESMSLQRTAFVLLLWAASAAAAEERAAAALGAAEGGARYVSDIADRVALACEQGRARGARGPWRTACPPA